MNFLNTHTLITPVWILQIAKEEILIKPLSQMMFLAFLFWFGEIWASTTIKVSKLFTILDSGAADHISKIIDVVFSGTLRMQFSHSSTKPFSIDRTFTQSQVAFWQLFKIHSTAWHTPWEATFANAQLAYIVCGVIHNRTSKFLYTALLKEVYIKFPWFLINFFCL